VDTINRADTWQTPKWLFDWIEKTMGIEFTLDPCTTEENPLGVEKFYTEEDDGLIHSWAGETVFVNPPHSRALIKKFTMKCLEEADLDTLVVGLLPLRTAKWFEASILGAYQPRILVDLSEYEIMPTGTVGIHFLIKRVRYVDPVTGLPVKTSPYFDSFIAVWR